MLEVTLRTGYRPQGINLFLGFGNNPLSQIGEFLLQTDACTVIFRPWIHTVLLFLFMVQMYKKYLRSECNFYEMRNTRVTEYLRCCYNYWFILTSLIPNHQSVYRPLMKGYCIPWASLTCLSHPFAKTTSIACHQLVILPSYIAWCRS